MAERDCRRVRLSIRAGGFSNGKTDNHKKAECIKLTELIKELFPRSHIILEDYDDDDDDDPGQRVIDRVR